MYFFPPDGYRVVPGLLSLRHLGWAGGRVVPGLRGEGGGRSHSGWALRSWPPSTGTSLSSLWWPGRPGVPIGTAAECWGPACLSGTGTFSSAAPRTCAGSRSKSFSCVILLKLPHVLRRSMAVLGRGVTLPRPRHCAGWTQDSLQCAAAWSLAPPRWLLLV